LSTPSNASARQDHARRLPEMRALIRFPGVLPALLLMGAVTVALVVVLSITDRSLDQFDRTTQAMVQAERLLSTLCDAETGQRGFLLTGDTAYLEPYHDAVARIDGEIDAMAALLAADPSSGTWLTGLRTLAGSMLDELAGTIALYHDQGLNAAVAIVRTHVGKRTMDALRGEIADRQRVVAEAISQARTRQRTVVGVAEVVAGATHETGWRDLTVYWSVPVLPLSTKGEWRCRSRNWSSIFPRSRIRGVLARSIIG
jgi:CHASE3 domain sensor protein